MAPLLTNAGKAITTNRVKGSGTEPSYVAWGTSATAEAATQTTLVAAASESRTAGTSSQVTVTTTNDTYQVTGTITSASAQSIQEVGLFDASTSGNMYMRGVHGSTTLAIGDSIAYTIKVTYS
jgi:hypothetical protein